MLYVLNLSRLVEFALEEFYTTCAEHCPETADFWNRIAVQERRHAHYIGRIEELFQENPQAFTPKKKVTLDEIRDFIHDVETVTRRVSSGKCDCRSLPSLAEGFEDTVLERSFYDLLDSADVEYNELVRIIKEESIGHRILIHEHDWTLEAI